MTLNASRPETLSRIRHLTIVGCGLIGGSLALALRRAGFRGRITASGGQRGPQWALDHGLIDSIEESFDNGRVCDADLVYLAAPISGIIHFLERRGSLIKPGALVTDAGSTKLEISRVAKTNLPDSVTFIGGHPMAGSELRGVEHAREGLFDGAVYALTPDERTDPQALEVLVELIRAIGANQLLAEPSSHDAAVALISHLPQLLSTSLVSLPEATASNTLAHQLAASGWRDMTRLAASSWTIWRDSCTTNQTNIANALELMIERLKDVREAVASGDFEEVREAFERANLVATK
jgi:prephenate dehydrogenase